MDNVKFLSDNLELMEKQLRYSLRIVANLQTLLSDTESTGKEYAKIEDDNKVLKEKEIKLYNLTTKRIVDKYFSNTLILSATGNIKVSDTLKQYGDDILRSPIENINVFPDGFYINSEEKTLQFLIQLDPDDNNVKLIIDKLDDNPVFYLFDNGSLDDKISQLDTLDIYQLEVYETLDRYNEGNQE